MPLAPEERSHTLKTAAIHCAASVGYAITSSLFFNTNATIEITLGFVIAVALGAAAAIHGFLGVIKLL